MSRRRLIAMAATALCAGLGRPAGASTLCTAGLRTDCRAAGRSPLVIRRARDGARATLSWDWSKGAATTRADFGAPSETTAYGLCVYAGTSAAAIGEADVAPSARRWRAEGAHGFRYRARAARAGGVRAMLLRAGRAGKAKVEVRGAVLDGLPAGPLPLPVTVQLINGTTGACFEAVYDASVARRNDPQRFEAARHARWVGTWSASPVCFEAATLLGLPKTIRFDDQSVRMIVHASLGGGLVRVRLTNLCGSDPLVIGAATIGIREADASVRADTVRSLAFLGRPSVAVAPGSTITSDPVAVELPPLGDATITLYLPDPTVPTTSHPQAATGYLSGTGDFTGSSDGVPFATKIRQWVFLDSLDVLAPGDASAVVAFGDSIIDGAGSTYDANTRWPDFLARRLVAANERLGVLNQGINGNKVLNTLLGDSALSRFDRDVLGQAAVKYVVLLEGVNDIGLGHPDVTADDVIAGYRTLAARAHDAGLKIFGGTLTPAKDNVYPFYAPYDESKRQAINQFIREGSAFDAFIDFDAAVRDPADPAHWKPGYSVDGLHPDDAGAAAMGDAVDLSLFH